MPIRSIRGSAANCAAIASSTFRLDELSLPKMLFGNQSGIGHEDRQAPRDEEGDRGAGAQAGRDHAPHMG